MSSLGEDRRVDEVLGGYVHDGVWGDVARACSSVHYGPLMRELDEKHLLASPWGALVSGGPVFRRTRGGGKTCEPE